MVRTVPKRLAVGSNLKLAAPSTAVVDLGIRDVFLDADRISTGTIETIDHECRPPSELFAPNAASYTNASPAASCVTARSSMMTQTATTTRPTTYQPVTATIRSCAAPRPKYPA